MVNNCGFLEHMGGDGFWWLTRKDFDDTEKVAMLEKR